MHRRRSPDEPDDPRARQRPRRTRTDRTDRAPDPARRRAPHGAGRAQVPGRRRRPRCGAQPRAGWRLPAVARRAHGPTLTAYGPSAARAPSHRTDHGTPGAEGPARPGHAPGGPADRRGAPAHGATVGQVPHRRAARRRPVDRRRGLGRTPRTGPRRRPAAHLRRRRARRAGGPGRHAAPRAARTLGDPRRVRGAADPDRAHRPGARGRDGAPPLVRRVRVCAVDPHAAEATVIAHDGQRVRAVALRLETHRGAWRVTALEVG
ncbi:Rv3235 family protein [Cellulomonas soli]